MSAINDIKKRLERYPDVHYELGENIITIPASSPNGFSVSMFEGDSMWVVSFEGWHEHFGDAQQALNCFAFGLSADCRLKVALRGTFAYRWTVQSRSEDRWVDDAETVLMLFPFWRKKRIEYRQNNVIPPGEVPRPPIENT